jgi:hypothetical protein
LHALRIEIRADDRARLLVLLDRARAKLLVGQGYGREQDPERGEYLSWVETAD